MQFDKKTIHLLQHKISREGSIELPSIGNSMYPLIHQGDMCQFAACDTSAINKGDILLFWSETNQLVAHRFYYTQHINQELTYICKGDSNLGFDQPIKKERIIGKLVVIKRNNREFSTEKLKTVVWGRLILTLPFLSGVLRSYLNKRVG